MRKPDATTTFEIRPAQPEDTRFLRAIELDAAQRYGAIPEVRFCVALPTRGFDEHRRARDEGVALVAEAEDGQVGFLLMIPLDGRAHILEIAVASEHQGRGCGRRLIAAAEDWAIRKGFEEITLTTFRDVAWNAPFYARLGYGAFETGPDRPEFGALVADEIAAGVHRAPRVAMRKTLPLEIASGSSLSIRRERAREFGAIHEFIRKAFETAHYAEGDEQDFVDERRRTASYVPELALILADGDRMIAHLMLTRISISAASGPFPILLLACVAVDAEYRNRGLGSAFIARALRRAAALGHAAVVLVGDPAYYRRRLGFESSEMFGVSNENGVEARYVQMRELAPGALTGVSGSIILPS